MSFPNNITKIDRLTRPDHSFLCEDDKCYFLGEYTPRAGYGHSDTNQLISNLKKSVDRRGKPEWVYKGRAIRKAANNLRAAIKPSWLVNGTFVPIPPSKAQNDPLYDDRMTQVIDYLASEVDRRELLIQTDSMESSHQTDCRSSIDDLVEAYEIDEQLCEPPPERIFLCDDMITTGRHFVAAKTCLERQFPDAKIKGLFIARRVPEEGPEVDFSALLASLKK